MRPKVHVLCAQSPKQSSHTICHLLLDICSAVVYNKAALFLSLFLFYHFFFDFLIFILDILSPELQSNDAKWFRCGMASSTIVLLKSTARKEISSSRGKRRRHHARMKRGRDHQAHVAFLPGTPSSFKAMPHIVPVSGRGG
ncbi:hypothetical protein ACRALDRAFT_206074 [Sodiomyces alcalophilus JCM 7366]|uniref:uncharacterized protein n=1 Tax=Sodiomyces alcalophilus JCM 7366 TaxID=591952 RepID=UPI0039B44696